MKGYLIISFEAVVAKCNDACNEIHYYVSLFMKAPVYVNMDELKTTGTAVCQLPAKEIARILFQLPLLSEQKHIVAKPKTSCPCAEK